MSGLRTCAVAALAIVMMGCHSAGPVRVGVVVSDPGVGGARAAEADVNAAGGINGRRLELRLMSEGGTTIAHLALAVAESLADDPSVVAVVGHANSSASISAAQIYNERGLVQIAPTSSAPRLTSAGPFTFRLVPNDLHQAQFLVKQIVAQAAVPRIALFYVNDDYGRALFLEMRARLADAHVPIVYQRPYEEEKPFVDADVVARSVADAHADLLVWLGRQPQLHDLLPSLRKLLPRLPILGSDALDGVATAENVDGAFTGVRYVCFLDVSASTIPMQQLRDKLRAHGTATVTPEAVLNYDAVMLVAAAARTVGTKRAAIRDYLASLGTTRAAFPGTAGPIAFDKQGDPAPSYCLAEVTRTGPHIILPSSPP